jgi:hypothetical protein
LEYCILTIASRTYLNADNGCCPSEFKPKSASRESTPLCNNEWLLPSTQQPTSSYLDMSAELRSSSRDFLSPYSDRNLGARTPVNDEPDLIDFTNLDRPTKRIGDIGYCLSRYRNEEIDHQHDGGDVFEDLPEIGLNTSRLEALVPAYHDPLSRDRFDFDEFKDNATDLRHGNITNATLSSPSDDSTRLVQADPISGRADLTEPNGQIAGVDVESEVKFVSDLLDQDNGSSALGDSLKSSSVIPTIESSVSPVSDGFSKSVKSPMEVSGFGDDLLNEAHSERLSNGSDAATDEKQVNGVTGNIFCVMLYNFFQH